MKNAPRDPFLPAHLTETQIVAYLDGELPRPDQEAARAPADKVWVRSQIRETTDCLLAGRLMRTRVGVERVDLQADESGRLGAIRVVRYSEAKETYVSARSVAGQVEEAMVDLESLAEK